MSIIKKMLKKKYGKPKSEKFLYIHVYGFSGGEKTIINDPAKIPNVKKEYPISRQ